MVKIHMSSWLPTGGFDVAIGAGDNAYSSDGEFALVNVSLSSSKDIKISEDFSLPLSGSLIYNPDVDIMYVAFGIVYNTIILC